MIFENINGEMVTYYDKKFIDILKKRIKLSFIRMKHETTDPEEVIEHKIPECEWEEGME